LIVSVIKICSIDGGKLLDSICAGCGGNWGTSAAVTSPIEKTINVTTPK